MKMGSYGCLVFCKVEIEFMFKKYRTSEAVDSIKH